VAVDRAIRRIGRPLRWAAAGFLIGIGCLVAPLMLWVALSGQLGLAPVSGMLAVPLAMISLGVLTLRGSFAYSGGNVRNVLLEGGLCPSCLVALKGVARDSDGCVTCPECGAAWTPAPDRL
jgi:hypothetical protein